MEEDNQEWWKRSRKVRINRSSRVWKRVTEIEVPVQDTSASEGEETSQIDDTQDENIGNKSKEEDATPDSTGDGDEVSTDLSEDGKSADITLEKDKRVSDEKRRSDDQNYDGDEENINGHKDETNSRVWNRVTEIEARTQDTSASEDEQPSQIDDNIDENIGNKTIEEDVTPDSLGDEDEFSTDSSEDVKSDITLEKYETVCDEKQRNDDQDYEEGEEKINEHEDEELYDPGEGDITGRKKRNVEYSYNQRLSSDLTDEVFEENGESLYDLEIDMIINVADEHSSDKQEQNENSNGIDSVNDELNNDIYETTHPIDSDCTNYDEHIWEENQIGRSRSAFTKYRKQINSNVEQPVTNHDESEESGNANKDSSDEASREHVRENLVSFINRSVSDPTYDHLFKDPFECLNSMLEEKQERKNNMVTDGQMSSRPTSLEKGKEDAEKSKLGESKFEEESEKLTSELILEQINPRALLKNSKTYELENFEKNALIIFNQENIKGYKPRLGTRQDAEALAATFGKYGFEIEEHVDLVREDIFRELKKFSERDFTDYGCVAVAIMTHGADMGELKAADRCFYEMDVLNFLKTRGRPTLVTKPKIVIIQACRGSRATQAAHVMRHGRTSTDHEDVRQQHYTLPVEADTLVLHSTYVGNISHRNEIHGSWFIQTLCGKINELASAQDLESIITEVKREVAIDKVHEIYNRRTHEIDLNKQMPVVTSTLIRKLYLRKYEDCDVSEANVTSELNNADVSEDAATSERSSHASVSQSAVEENSPSCYCFLDRFEYLRDCMRHFVEDNPDDETARSFLDVAEVLDEGAEFNVAKEKISRAIRNHLQSNATGFEFFKYLYLFNKD